MEDMYRDLRLRHFVDVNALQELRDDNKELKAKLDEHSAAMEKLQKGYDILDMEFRTLQCNYNSLLTSARAEIQKKTQMIAQLNAEKEAIMMNAIKGGKHIRRHVNQVVKHQCWINYDKALGRGKKIMEDDPKQDNDDITCER